MSGMRAQSCQLSSQAELRVGCPSGRPALSASRTGPVVPAHSGDDQEQLEIEREFLEDALCPAHLEMCSLGRGVFVLTRRHSCLSHCRTPAGALVARAGRPTASRRARVRSFVRIAGAILARERQGLRPLVPETGNRCPRVAGCARWPAPGHRFPGFPSPSHPRRKAGRLAAPGGFQPWKERNGGSAAANRACGAECRGR